MTATVLLTGAGSGIGAALAARLHARGDRLVLPARSASRAADLAARFAGASTPVLDLADLAEPARLEAALAAVEVPDRLDALVHCAGVVDLAPVASATLASWREQVDVNLLAPAMLTRHALPALRAARGTVVLVNSTAGINANAGWGAYAASKFGLHALADSLRAEEAPHGVRVTTVFPSRTATPMQERVHAQEGSDYDAARWIRAETVAESILGVLDLPADATVTDLVLRPGPGGNAVG